MEDRIVKGSLGLQRLNCLIRGRVIPDLAKESKLEEGIVGLRREDKLTQVYFYQWSGEERILHSFKADLQGFISRRGDRFAILDDRENPCQLRLFVVGGEELWRCKIRKETAKSIIDVVFSKYEEEGEEHDHITALCSEGISTGFRRTGMMYGCSASGYGSGPTSLSSCGKFTFRRDLIIDSFVSSKQIVAVDLTNGRLWFDHRPSLSKCIDYYQGTSFLLKRVFFFNQHLSLYRIDIESPSERWELQKECREKGWESVVKAYDQMDRSKVCTDLNPPSIVSSQVVGFRFGLKIPKGGVSSETNGLGVLFFDLLTESIAYFEIETGQCFHCLEGIVRAQKGTGLYMYISTPRQLLRYWIDNSWDLSVHRNYSPTSHNRKYYEEVFTVFYLGLGFPSELILLILPLVRPCWLEWEEM